MPAVPVSALGARLLLLTLALLLGGGYERIERLALVKVGFFTLLTVLAALVLTRMPEQFSWARAAEGLRPTLPGSGLVTAVAVFGITGVGGTELFMYPYWCVEKGYARFVGRRDGQRRLAGARARLDPADARRHPAVDGRLHDRHRGLLLPRGRRPPRPGPRARRRAT